MVSANLYFLDLLYYYLYHYMFMTFGKFILERKI